MKDERKKDSNQMEIIMWLGLAALFVHFYVELHVFFQGVGFANPKVDEQVDKFVYKSGLFNSPWLLKSIAGFAIVSSSLGSRSVKSVTLTRRSVAESVIVGTVLFFGGTLLLSWLWIRGQVGISTLSIIYLLSSGIGVLYLIKGVQGINRLTSIKLGADTFNSENESFPQEERLLANKESVNIRIKYIHRGKECFGWLNISNPRRGNMVVGTAGSGKTYGIVNTIIRQSLEKGRTMYVYDFKFPELSLVTLNAMIRHQDKLPKGIKYYCINFDNPAKSHRCNPLHPYYINEIADANETGKTFLLNLNKNWITDQGKFFVESPINYITALIWFLRCYQGGKFCTMPHLLELTISDYRKVFPILMSNPQVENFIAPFVSAYVGGAMEQLQGQIDSARVGIARLTSPAIYWVMTGNDFMLDINNPEAPKIVCIGNNNDRQDIYSAALGLYNSRLMTQVNKPGKLPSSLVIDELSTIYFRGIDRLINTGRSNGVAVTLAMQDYTQLDKDYGKAEADVIKNTVGTLIAGQVKGSTAESIERLMGKNVQRKESINVQSEDVSQNYSTELNYMMPSSKISSLDPGWVCGVVASAFEQPSKLKAFHALTLIDDEDFKAEQKLKELPDFSIFADGPGTIQQQIDANFLSVKADIAEMIRSETERIQQALNE